MNRAIIKLIPAILLTGQLITAAQAQGKGQEIAEKVANLQTARMEKELNLTADQASKVGQINLAEARNFQRLFSKYKAGANRQEMIREALAINRSREAQLQKVLTPQQWQTRQANRSERAARMMTRLMTLQLNLTDQQIPEVEQINMTAARNIQSELGRAGGQQGNIPREKLRTVVDIRSAMEERDQGLQKILTPEQWGIYEQRREEMREIMRQRLLERIRQ
jgi:hypothetical protein